MAEKSKSDRIRIMVDSVRKAVGGNYAIRIDASGKNNELDALADGINALLDKVAEQITDRQKAEEKLRRSEARHRKIFETINDALAVGDANGVLTYVNPRFCEILAAEEKALIGRKFIEFLDETNRNRWLEQQNQRRQGLSGTYELEISRSDGSKIVCSASGGPIMDADGRYAGSVGLLTDITERKQLEESLRKFQSSMDRASDAVFWMDREGRFSYVNEQACLSLGYSREELMRLRLWDIDPGFSKELWAKRWEDRETVSVHRHESSHRRKDGVFFPVEVSAKHIRFSDGELHVAFVRDITERKRAEEEKARLESQLIQAQKMESVGRLAGGVAHDFNNMLGVIVGYAELIKSELAADDPLLKDVLEIEKAANHSRDVTRQLLAFSRKQLIEPRPLDLNNLINNTKKTLSRLIGEDIELCFNPGEDLWKINFDPSQVDQILINLAVNARDAMLNGGKLTIETANVQLDEAYCREHLADTPGDYVMLSVKDSGVGMDKETLSHAFEPFFTTKEVGKGTGLGLSTIYGIIKQNGGSIHVYSEPARGTAFKIYIPRKMQEDEIAATTEDSLVISGSETILLVEDEDMVRDMTTAMLEKIGYSVRVAETPQEALLFCENNDIPIDLLITDVVMPEMNGTELRDRIKAIRPGIKVLFMSGYTSNVIGHHGVLDKGVHFVQKPFGLKGLARKVRDAIKGQGSGDSPKGGTSPSVG